MLGGIGGVIAGMLLLMIPAAFGISSFHQMRGHGGGIHDDFILAAMEISAAGVVVAFLPSLSQKTLQELGFVWPNLRSVVVATIATLAMVAFDFGYDQILGLFHLQNHVQAGFENYHFDSAVAAVVGFTTASVVAPLCEETVFRAFLFNALASHLNAWVALFLNGCLFAALHLDPVLAPLFIVVGMVNGWIYQRTGSIATAMIAHGLINAIATTRIAFQSFAHHAPGATHGH